MAARRPITRQGREPLRPHVGRSSLLGKGGAGSWGAHGAPRGPDGDLCCPGDPLRSPVDLVASGPHGGVVRLLQRLGSAEPPGRELVGPTRGCPQLPWEVMGEAEERHLGLARRLKLVGWGEGRHGPAVQWRRRHQFILGWSLALTPLMPGDTKRGGPCSGLGASLPSRLLQVEHTRMFFDTGN